VDMDALQSLLVAFSQLVVEQPWIKEIDINPLLASADRLLALDARVVIFEKDTKEEDLSKPAIRPYPAAYISQMTTKEGFVLNIRPIRPEDEPLMVKFHEHLSDRSVYLRYFQPMQLSQRTTHERLTRICFIDYDRELALVAERLEPGTNQSEILAVARLSRMHGTNSAELTIIIKDEFQHKGIGAGLLSRAVDVARQEKLGKLIANMLRESQEMQSLCRKHGFELSTASDKYVHAELKL